MKHLGIFLSIYVPTHMSIHINLSYKKETSIFPKNTGPNSVQTNKLVFAFANFLVTSVNEETNERKHFEALLLWSCLSYLYFQI